MSIQEPDIFELLDIEDREDTYSSLLVHLLRASADLRARIFKYAFGADTPSAEHVTVELRKGLGEHGIVDILVAPKDPTQRWLLFIETKVFSGEHREQTRRYLAACRERVGPDGRAAGVFLTLGNKPPTEPEVRSLTHRELTAWIEDCLAALQGRPALHLAAMAYIARAQVPLPEATDTRPIAKLFFERTSGLVPHLAGTSALGAAIKPASTSPWQHTAIWIQGRGHANPGLQFWREGWRGAPIKGRQWTRDNVFIHLEIELTEGPPWRLKLHFETEPYYTQAELATLDGYKDFIRMRDAFRAVVHANLIGSSKWKISNYPLQSAVFKFTPKAGETVEGLRKTLLPAFTQILPVVETALAAVRPTPALASPEPT